MNCIRNKQSCLFKSKIGKDHYPKIIGSARGNKQRIIDNKKKREENLKKKQMEVQRLGAILPLSQSVISGSTSSVAMMCPQSWRGLPASLQLSQSPYSCPFFAMPSRCLRDAFAMLSLEVLCPWSFPTVTGASQSSAELRSLPWSSPVFSGVLQSLPELLLVRRSSSLSAGVPPCLPELLLLPQSPFPLEFFGDSSRSFPCLRRAFLLSPMMLLLHHSFAVP